MAYSVRRYVHFLIGISTSTYLIRDDCLDKRNSKEFPKNSKDTKTIEYF